MTARGAQRQGRESRGRFWGRIGYGVWAYCLAWAVCTPRFEGLDRQSFWYDEVVSMRLAEQLTPVATLQLLKEIDATRAPLHPLLLHYWLRKFGASEWSGRAFSGACGVVTCAVVFAIARRLGGRAAGFWAATFAALSPLLVEYDREARMYALLTMLSTLAWWNLLRFRDGAPWGRVALQVGVMTALSFTHPLGLLMIAALAIGWGADRRWTKLTVRKWLVAQGACAALVAPWIGHYLDHPPEFLTRGQSVRLLVGMPIGFTGGDARTLLLLAAVIAAGLVPRGIATLSRPRPEGSDAGWPIVVWLAVPPLLLFAYSRVAHPLFGPARYNVDVAPAYLILVGLGLARLRPMPGALIGGAVLLAFAMPGAIAQIESRRKADWRAAARWLDTQLPGVPVAIIAPIPGQPFELEVARYYFGAKRPVVAYPERAGIVPPEIAPDEPMLLFATPTRDGAPLRPIPREIEAQPMAWPFPGLRFYAVIPRLLPRADGGRRP